MLDRTPSGGAPAADAAALPRHVAIIMDGNGRWAARRGLPRSFGHRKGIDAVRRTVRHASARGISCLTLYAFSMENWNRPEREVGELMSLMRTYIDGDLSELSEAGVRIRVIGARERLTPGLLEMIAKAEGETAGNDGMMLQVAFNYGGRDEIVRAARRALAAGVAPDDLTEQRLSAFLDTAGVPDPDLVIRTSGERRISNFLLWQCAYAEFVFAEAMWPEFDEALFDRALEDYRARERRFGELPAGAGAP